MQDKDARCRARDLGLVIGALSPGAHNAITDVPGVRVGHATIISGEGRHVPGEGPVRTGVTAVLPRAGNVFEDRVVAGSFVLNGAGEVSGLTQVTEWGQIETPILLTNTHAVGAVSEAAVRYMVETYPEIGIESDVIIPVVGECDDSWLSDVIGRHVRRHHVFEAIESAVSGPVEEGSVGGGTGMITCGFKSGIGASSRMLGARDGGFTVGILVMSNWGLMEDLRLDGIPIGGLLKPDYADLLTRNRPRSSIIAVAATDAPLHTHQLNRLAKRVALGIGRAGSYAANTSGEIVVAFSTANTIPGHSEGMVYSMNVLLDQHMDALYLAAVEATEEAILNSLCAATEMTGRDGRFVPAIPLDRVVELVKKYRPQTHEPAGADG